MRSNFTYWIIKSAPIIGPVVDWLDAHESQCSTEVAFTVRPWKATLDTLLGGGGGGQHCMQMSGSAAHRWTLVSLTYLMLPLSVLPLKRALGFQQSDVDVIHWFQPLDKRRPWLSPGRNQNWARYIVFIYSFDTGMHTIVQRYSSLVRPRLRVHYVPVSTARTQRLYVVLRSPAVFLQNPTVATGRHGVYFQLWLQCDWRLVASLSGALGDLPVAWWHCGPPAELFVRAPALLLERQLAAWSLAEWLTSGWGALWWSCQPCCVAFSWQRLSRRTQKRIRMQLPLSSVHNFFFPTDRLCCSFHLSGPSRQEKWWWGHMALEFTKKALWQSVRAQEKETKLFAVRGENKSRAVRCGSV